MSSPLGVILNSINNKGALLDQEYIEREYKPFVINRSLSYMVDTVLFAHELNRLPNMPVYDQYLFYYHSLSKKKRFAKWHKAPKDKYLQVVMEYYGYSARKAQTALAILSVDQCKEIAGRIDKGGKKK